MRSPLIAVNQLVVTSFLGLMLCLSSCQEVSDSGSEENLNELDVVVPQDTLEIIIGTFLGNEQRNYYGDSIGDDFNELWRLNIGAGTTNLADGPVEWRGAGWTGQPLIVREKDQKFLLLGCYDHQLKKIDAQTGHVVWSYLYDDVIKGTGSLWMDSSAENEENRLVILQGSRLGVKNSLASKEVYSYRGVSYHTGNELWRLNSKRSRSYSRDVDASALAIGDTAYVGLENGSFISFNPGQKHAKPIVETPFFTPNIIQELPLYEDKDVLRHGGNLVTEASPALLGDHIYVASGSGHVYGYNLKTRKIDWQFDIGADLDGSPFVTADGCLLVTVEKQYIKGKGGVFKLDPSKSADACVVWYFPTEDRDFADWRGGVIGSVAINDAYNKEGLYPSLAAFTGIDGWFYLLNHTQIDNTKRALGPNEEHDYPMPKLIEKRKIGPSISTPIIVQNKILAAGYQGLHLYSVDQEGRIVNEVKKEGVFEATPVADRGNVFIASRNGFLYCFGNVAQREKNTTLSARTATTEVKQVQQPSVTKEMSKNKTKIKTNVETASNKIKPNDLQVVSLNKGNYYLISGAFGVRSNAEGKVKSLKHDGVQAFMAFGPNELYYVVVGQASNEVEINAKKETLLRDQSIDSWVYQK